MSSNYRRVISGNVIKISGNKSISILVERRVLHSRYRKIIKKFKKYIVHDESNDCSIGDIIEAVECKPISKSKSFKLFRVISTGVDK